MSTRSMGYHTLLLILLLLSGCSSVPSLHILNISSTTSKIVVHDSRGYLRTFDPATGEWSTRIRYDNIKYGGSHVPPSVERMLKFNGEVIIQITYGAIYKFNDVEGLKLITNNVGGTLTGIDQDYYYITSVLNDRVNPDYFEVKDFRINKRTLKVEAGHFPGYPNLTVIDTKVADRKQAYLCISLIKYSDKDRKYVEWQPHLIVRSMDTSSEDTVIDIPGTYQSSIYNRFGLVSFVNSTEKGIAFRTSERFNTRMCSYDGQKSILCTDEFKRSTSTTAEHMEYTDYITWNLSPSTDSPRTLQELDTISGMRKYYPGPAEINIYMLSDQHLSKNFFWCSGYKFRSFLGDMPYLVRFTVPGGDAKTFQLEPGLYERLETVFLNFIRDLNPVTYLGPG